MVDLKQQPGAANDAARIEITHLTKRFMTRSGEPFTAIRDVTLTVEPGQFCAIVGPTGCGKSTTLGQVSGLDRPSAGSVRVGGREVHGVTSGVSFMFQADALFPWKSVLGNVMIGPTLNGTSRKDAVALARDWLRRVGLAGFEDRYPHQLSGGMRKRVAMAAALINSPRILLMDEPFGALDVQTKAIMQTELLGLWEQLRPSVLFITHDLDEAVALADRVLVMTSEPRLDQAELRHRPPPPAGRGAGDPARAALPRAAEPDLGLAQGRGTARVRADGRCGMSVVSDVTVKQQRTVTAEPDAEIRQAARRAKRRRVFWLWIARLGLAVFIIGGWQLCTAQGWVDKFYYGQPSLIWKSLVQLFTKGTEFGSMWDDIAVTLQEAVYGFLLGTAVGVIFGLLLGQNRFLADVLNPYIKIVNAVPRIILGGIFLVAFGLGIFPKILLAGVLVFFIVFFNAFQGVREVNPNLVANVKVLGASPLQVARHVTIPSALTWIIASLHTAFGFAIIGALVRRFSGRNAASGWSSAKRRVASIRTPSSPAWRSWPPSRSSRNSSSRCWKSAFSPGARPATPNRPASDPASSHPPTERNTRMLKRALTLATIGALALGATAACSSSKSGSNGSGGSSMPTVSLMVGGIDKQIYLPYKLADELGFYKKYGVNVKLSTETNGGVGAEDAMASGQVDMAGAWYIHTIDFQSKGKQVEDIVQLSGAPGEREMCGMNSGVHSAADFKGKTLGVTDLGSGTDELTQFMAAQKGISRSQYHTLAVGAGATAIAAIQRGTAQCVMTTQPTVGALEAKKLAYPAIDLATTAGAQQALGGAWPAASVLAQTSWVNSHKDTVQKVVDALVATLHWINTHSAADIANKLPADYVQNSTISKAQYIAGLTTDKGQFLPDGVMPAGGPKTIYAMEKLIGTDVSKVTLANTFTNSFVMKANQVEGFKTTTPPAGAAG